MSTADKVFRAIGIGLAGSVLAWLVSFGVAWVAETAQHLPASVGSDPVWLILPSIASAGSWITGIATSAEKK